MTAKKFTQGTSDRDAERQFDSCLLSHDVPRNRKRDRGVYDVVVLNGRVMDPESNLDAVRNLGIRGARFRRSQESRSKGRTVPIDATVWSWHQGSSIFMSRL